MLKRRNEPITPTEQEVSEALAAIGRMTAQYHRRRERFKTARQYVLVILVVLIIVCGVLAICWPDQIHNQFGFLIIR